MREIVKELFPSDSSFVAIQGNKGTGKTSLALYLMEIAYALGIFKYFAGNAELENTPFPYVVIRSLEALQQYCESLNHRVLFLFDEMGLNVPRGTPWARLNTAFIVQLQVIRKYKLSLIGCLIGDSISDTILNPDHLDAVIEKVGLTEAVFKDYRRSRATFIEGIPKPRTKFKQYQVAVFNEKATELIKKTVYLTPEQEIAVQKKLNKQPLTNAESSLLKRLKERDFQEKYGGIELSSCHILSEEKVVTERQTEG